MMKTIKAKIRDMGLKIPGMNLETGIAAAALFAAVEIVAVLIMMPAPAKPHAGNTYEYVPKGDTYSYDGDGPKILPKPTTVTPRGKYYDDVYDDSAYGGESHYDLGGGYHPKTYSDYPK